MYARPPAAREDGGKREALESSWSKRLVREKTEKTIVLGKVRLLFHAAPIGARRPY